MVSPLTAVLYLTACVGLLFMPVSERGFDRFHLVKELWLAGCALAALAVTWKRKVPLDGVTVTLVALIGAAALSASLATSPVLALRGLGLIACAAVLLTVTRTCTDDEAAAVRGAVVIAAAGIAAVALLEAFGVVSGLSGPGRAPGSTIGQRNSAAHTMLIVSPAAWTMAARAPTRGERVLGAIAAALLVAGIVVTRSRAAWLLLPAALVVWLLLTKERRRVVVPIVALAAAIALALPTALAWTAPDPYLDTAARLFDASSGSGAGRLVQYRATLELIASHPLIGVGPGNWMVQYPTVSPPGDPTFRTGLWLHTGRLANSDWVALLAEGGIVAALLVLGFLFFTLRALERDAEGAAVLAATLGVGALDPVVQLPAAAAYAALLLALSMRKPAAREAPWPLKGLLGAVLAAAIVLAGRRVLALQTRTWPTPTYGAAEASLKWNPDDLQARFQLAESYVRAGACDRARPHVATLRRLLPNHHQPRQMEAACRLTE